MSVFSSAGYSLSSLHPNSSTPPPAPSSPSPSLVESVDSDLWEMESESSGVLSEPAYGLSPTDASVVAQSTVTDASDNTGPLLGHRGEQAWGTAAPDGAASEEQQGAAEEERRSVGRESSVPTQVPTIAEMGPVPSGVPLQPEVSEHDGTEEEEEMVGGEEEEEEERMLAPGGGEEEDEEERGEEREWMESRGRHHHTPLTTVLSSSVMPALVFTQVPWQHLGPSDTDGQEEQESELRHGDTEYMTESDLLNPQLSQETVQVRNPRTATEKKA